MGRLVPRIVLLCVAATVAVALVAVAPILLGPAVLAFTGAQPHSCGGG